MALGAGDLVLCSGTLHRDTGFRERAEAAAAGGFAAISLWGRDYSAARASGLSDADIRALLDDNDLGVAELDPAWWWLPGAADIGRSIRPEDDEQGVFAYGEDELFTIADAVGARSVNAVDVFGGDWSVDDAAGAFASLCDRAANHGLLVHLEFLPWSRVPDLTTAWAIVRQADRPNGGITVDSWHFFRGDNTLDDLRAIPGSRVLGIQLDDGPADPEANLIEATLHDRRLPGDGDFELVGLIDVLRAIGTEAPVGVEVFSDELHALPPSDAARRAGDATRRLLAR